MKKRTLSILLVGIVVLSAFPMLVSEANAFEDNTDADGDGLPDEWESSFSGYSDLNPNDDLDGDLLTNLEEFQYSPELNPTISDTDGDGLSDGWEVYQKFNPVSFVTTPSLDWGTEIDDHLDIFNDYSTGNCGPTVEPFQLHRDSLIFTDPAEETVENRWNVQYLFSEKDDVTIEFYFSASNTTKRSAFYIMDEGSPNCLMLDVFDEDLSYYDGTDHFPIMPLFSDVWYHFKIEFNCDDDWHLWVDGISKDEGAGYEFRGDPLLMDKLLFIGDTSTNNFSVRYDKFGFSWETTSVNDAAADPDGDGMINLEEFEYSLELDPTNPDTDADGLFDGWEVEYNFNPLTFVTTPSLGWGTEANPSWGNYLDYSGVNCEKSVESYQLRQDCLVLTDTSSTERWKLYDYYFSNQKMGTVEFYFSTSDPTKSNSFYFMDAGSNDCILLQMREHKLTYYNGTAHTDIMPLFPDVWYHIKIEFDCDTDWHLWVDGISMDNGAGYEFRGDPSYMNKLLLLGDTLKKDYSVRYDQIVYSWETTSANEATADPDGDDMTNLEEFQYSLELNPTIPDTDADGLFDGLEVNTYFTDPLNDDTDNDQLGDWQEVNTYFTDPLDADSDDDSLVDIDEIFTFLTNPNLWDSDGDGFGDDQELKKYHSNPNDDLDPYGDHFEFIEEDLCDLGWTVGGRNDYSVSIVDEQTWAPRYGRMTKFYTDQDLFAGAEAYMEKDVDITELGGNDIIILNLDFAISWEDLNSQGFHIILSDTVNSFNELFVRIHQSGISLFQEWSFFNDEYISFNVDIPHEEVQHLQVVLDYGNEETIVYLNSEEIIKSLESPAPLNINTIELLLDSDLTYTPLTVYADNIYIDKGRIVNEIPIDWQDIPIIEHWLYAPTFPATYTYNLKDTVIESREIEVSFGVKFDSSDDSPIKYEIESGYADSESISTDEIWGETIPLSYGDEDKIAHWEIRAKVQILGYAYIGQTQPCLQHTTIFEIDSNYGISSGLRTPKQFRDEYGYYPYNPKNLNNYYTKSPVIFEPGQTRHDLIYEMNQDFTYKGTFSFSSRLGFIVCGFQIKTTSALKEHLFWTSTITNPFNTVKYLHPRQYEVNNALNIPLDFVWKDDSFIG
jgi:hypothetical protein